MKIQISSRRRPDGYALLLLVLMLSAATIWVLAANMMRTSTVSNLNARNNQLSVLNNAAEAATEKVYAQMSRDFSAYGPGYVSNNVPTYNTIVPTSGDNIYWTNFQFSDAQGNANHTYVSQLTNYTGPLPTQYTNQFATTSPIYRIISNAGLAGSPSNIIGTAQEDLMLALLPITTYAIFYNGELEFSDCATMTVSGRVHSNADICTGAGSGATLTFNGAVTCCGAIASPGRGGLTYTLNQNTTFNSTKSTNVVSLQISIPMTNTHSIIEIPPAGELATSTTGQQREYNKAQVVLIITNSLTTNLPAVYVRLQDSYSGNVPGADPTPTLITLTNCTPDYLGTNTILPMAAFLSLTNTFCDQREYATNLYVTQINVGAYAAWLATNTVMINKLSSTAGNYPTILYVADRRNIGTNRLAVVRMTNAQKLPLNTAASGFNLGFSVATQNPLYIWGNYNTTIDGSHFALTVGSTTNGYTVPAALFSDSLTILSSSWADSKSTLGYTGRNAVASNMVLNAAIITGNIPSTGTSATTFSGGVHNLTRMLENWSSVTLTYNTSIVCLYASQMATNQFLMPYSSGSNPSGYYTPPTRNWGFDLTFYNVNQQPPGVPCALVPIRYNWVSPAPNSLASQ
jgi:hypothetical protein